MGRRCALLICNSKYQDDFLSSLTTPEADGNALDHVLRDKEIGGYEVHILKNQPSQVIRDEIVKFFTDKRKDDLLMLYFTGHGILDQDGQLYLATVDTTRQLLRARSISAYFIREEMDSCRSNRQVIILDCCHSGAFSRGTKGVIGTSVQTGDAFKGAGYGRVVITASDATQYAWEGGEQIIGQNTKSVFTNCLIEGLESGSADLNQDGNITTDELFSYVFDKVIQVSKDESKRQNPCMWNYKLQGGLSIANNPKVTLKSKSSILQEDEEIQQFIDAINQNSLKRAPFGRSGGSDYGNDTKGYSLSVSFEKRIGAITRIKDLDSGGSWVQDYDYYYLSLNDFMHIVRTLKTSGHIVFNCKCVYYHYETEHDQYDYGNDYSDEKSSMGTIELELQVDNHNLNIINLSFITADLYRQGATSPEFDEQAEIIATTYLNK